MKNVDVIYAYWLTSLNGPSKNLIRFKENRDYFFNSDVCMNFYTIDIIEKKYFTNNVAVKTSFKSIVLQLLKHLSRYSSFISWIFIKRSFKASERIVTYYKSIESVPDVVDFQDLFTCYTYLKHFPKSKAKIILFNHTNGEDFKMYKLYYPRFANSKYFKELIEIQDYVLKRVDRYMFISDLARIKFLEIHSEFPAVKTRFFHNGVPRFDSLEESEIQKNISNRDYSTHHLVCTGTVNRRKGQEILIKALSKIAKEKRKRIKITFLGEGDELKNFKKLGNKLKLDNHLSFVGGVNNVDYYLAKANIFILASKDEGLPLSIIEAMRAHLPIIGSNVAGIPEMIEQNVNGVLIEPTVESAENILNKLDDYNWQEMGESAYKTFEAKFTLNKMMGEYCKLINELI